MDRETVISSNILSIGYDDAENILEIEFTDHSIYNYFNVPFNEYENLMSAASHGKYFSSYIKNKFKYIKIN